MSTWFANARRRLKKENRGQWEGGPDQDKHMSSDVDDDLDNDNDDKVISSDDERRSAGKGERRELSKVLTKNYFIFIFFLKPFYQRCRQLLQTIAVNNEP